MGFVTEGVVLPHRNDAVLVIPFAEHGRCLRIHDVD